MPASGQIPNLKLVLYLSAVETMILDVAVEMEVMESVDAVIVELISTTVARWATLHATAGPLGVDHMGKNFPSVDNEA